MVAGPLVDDVHRLAVHKVAALRRGIVVSLCRQHEVGQQHVGLIHIDVVGGVHLGSLVERVAFRHHLVAESIDGIGPRIAKAQHLVDFLLRLSSRSVVQHAQGVGDAQRREQPIGLPTCLAEEVEGEVVVALHQLLLLL